MTPPPLQSPSAGQVIRFSCWKCSTELTVPAQMAGVTGPCPVCGQTLAAPAAVILQPQPLIFTPAPEPHLMRAPSSAPASPSTSVSQNTDGGGSSGYRRPMPSVNTAPRPAKGGSSSSSVKWESLIVIPFVILGGSMAAKFLGAMIGAGAWKLSGYCFKNTESQGARLGGLLVFLALGMGVFVGACDVLELPLQSDNGSGRFGSDMGGSSSDGLAKIHAEIERLRPGFFTEAEHAEAKAAVIRSGRTDMVTMAAIYSRALKTLAEHR